MRFIRPRQVLTMIGVSRTTLWRMVRGGLFPAPIRITKRNTGYILDDVESWMRERANSLAPAAAAHEGAGPRATGRSMLRAASRARG